ncbi:MAG TPA: hypothetical protein VGD72_14335 [Mycobacteriales bacterium]
MTAAKTALPRRSVVVPPLAVFAITPWPARLTGARGEEARWERLIRAEEAP